MRSSRPESLSAEAVYWPQSGTSVIDLPLREASVGYAGAHGGPPAVPLGTGNHSCELMTLGQDFAMIIRIVRRS